MVKVPARGCLSSTAGVGKTTTTLKSVQVDDVFSYSEGPLSINHAPGGMRLYLSSMWMAFLSSERNVATPGADALTDLRLKAIGLYGYFQSLKYCPWPSEMRLHYGLPELSLLNPARLDLSACSPALCFPGHFLNPDAATGGMEAPDLSLLPVPRSSGLFSF